MIAIAMAANAIATTAPKETDDRKPIFWPGVNEFGGWFRFSFTTVSATLELTVPTLSLTLTLTVVRAVVVRSERRDRVRSRVTFARASQRRDIACTLPVNEVSTAPGAFNGNTIGEVIHPAAFLK